jgi:hypothetical protein
MSVNLGPGLHVAVGRAVNTSSYDRWVGRWSRPFVPAVLAAAEVASVGRVLDVATEQARPRWGLSRSLAFRAL